jgi:ethanolamine ammonia-lyase small subunit
MQEAEIQAIVQAVLAEINKRQGTSNGAAQAAAVSGGNGLVIDLPDPTEEAARRTPGVVNPIDPEGLRALMSTTPTRIGVGRAGPRPRTKALLLFQADHGVTQDALFHEVNPKLLEEQGLFVVASQVHDRQEYLKRPDLGRRLTEESKRILAERCAKKPDVQIFVGDGLSGAAIEHNLAKVMPVLKQGLQAAGLTIGTPFFVKNARVGLLNDVNSIVEAKVCVLLIGERPGLARAESMSIYIGYQPKPDSTDANRDVVCNIYEGGLNPLEAGALAVQMIQKMIKYQTSGVDLKLAEETLNVKTFNV